MGRSLAPAPGTVGLDQFVNRAPALWRADRPGQDGRATLASGLGAIAPVWEWENPPEDADVSRPGPGRVGMDDVACIQLARDRYEQMYRTNARQAAAEADRDLLADLAEILGTEPVPVADLPAQLRELAPGYRPYAGLSGKALREQLAALGNRYPVDPAEIRKALALRPVDETD